MSKLTDELDQHLGLINSWYFALKGGAKIYITYNTRHAHAFSYSDPRADVLKRKAPHGYETEKTFRPTSTGAKPTERRNDCLGQATAYIAETYGYDGEWKMTPYRDAWVPVRAYDRVMDLLKAKRAEAKTQATS